MIPCPKCGRATRVLNTLSDVRTRACKDIKCGFEGSTEEKWRTTSTQMYNKVEIPEEEKSMDQRYDEYIERNSPLLELKKNKNMYLLSRERWEEWIAKQQQAKQAKQVQQQEEEKELNNPDLITEE
jgi:hypothetical protein